MKHPLFGLIAAAALFAGCDKPPIPIQPPAPKTAEPYNGIYKTEVNALEKAKEAGALMQQTETRQQQELEQVNK